MKSYGFGDRLTSEAGDFFEAVPGGADAYLLSMVLHDWNDRDAKRLLANVRAAASPGAHVLAFELVMPTGDQPHMSKMIDLTMLGIMNGRERTDSEMQALFEGAGFIYQGVVPNPQPPSRSSKPESLIPQPIGETIAPENRARQRAQDTELVVIGVGHDHPIDLALADVDSSRPERDETDRATRPSGGHIPARWFALACARPK